MDKLEAYKVHINDRGYNSWSFYTSHNFKLVELPIIPADCKLLSDDLFTIDENNNVNIIHSTIRTYKEIAGVLIVNNNKTYGRKNGKLLYKCVPDDIRLPAFLIPYEMKNVGFSKVFNNLYITFKFKEWNDKHPHATINQTIGPVDVLDNFYEYQLYCKTLNTSIQKFTKDTNQILKDNDHNKFIELIMKKHPSIIDRTNQSEWPIFSIDPEKSVDFDDAFSIKQLPIFIHNNKTYDNVFQLSIYISNVTIWIDFLNLWNSFSRRISTIYLPDRKRPMLPTILSDCLCSLQENVFRFSFVMDIFYNFDTNEIIHTTYSNCLINAFKNFIYEEPDLLNNENYKLLMRITKKLSYKYKYIPNIRNSHDIVCYLMILMNYHTAKVLLENNNGIFRTTIMDRKVFIPENIPDDVNKFFKIWNSSSGQYIDLSNIKDGEKINHDFLDIEAYVHITSPIRRLVDLLNIIKFQQNSNIIQLSDDSAIFYNKWINELEYINTTMRAIRTVQNDCNLLHLCYTNTDVMNKEYSGYIFDKIIRNDCLFQYIVYLPEIKMISRVVLRENYENYEKHNFKLYLFNDEEKFKKKIRLQLIIPL